ncbi:MAG: hypothetical protein JXR79_06990 [Nitrospirae bacterium]|nr:hypothetical protein [Nitrospirota bacterium]
MKRISVLFLAFMLFASFSFAAVNTYQVTGSVLEVKDDSITVQKGKEKWQVARDKDTKVTGDLKVGSKVTIQYTMKAVSVEAKAGKKETKKTDEKKTDTKKK